MAHCVRHAWLFVWSVHYLIRRGADMAHCIVWGVQYLIRRRVAWLIGTWVDSLKDPAPRS